MQNLNRRTLKIAGKMTGSKKILLPRLFFPITLAALIILWHPGQRFINSLDSSEE